MLLHYLVFYLHIAVYMLRKLYNIATYIHICMCSYIRICSVESHLCNMEHAINILIYNYI